MFYPVPFLEKANLFHPPGARALDVGTNDGRNARALAKFGYRVTAIDIDPMPQPIKGVRFRQTAIEKFRPRVPYDLIIARNVLQFTSDPLNQAARLARMLGQKGILAVTIFGENDPWVVSGRVQGATLQAAMGVFDHMQTLHCSNTLEFSPMLRSKGSKLWHILSFIVRRKA